MTFDKFIQKYNGKEVDYDESYGVQCVDLIKIYLKEVLGIEPQAIGNAEAYWNRYDELTYLNNHFDRIKNTLTFKPEKGDICVWGTGLSKNGHVAIATGESTLTNFYSYDENWGIKAMHKVNHSYKNGFLGVLRPKQTNNLTSFTIYESPKQYINGSSVETVYKDSNCTTKIGSLETNEKAICLGIVDNKAIIVYNLSNGKNYAVGFVKWLGGIK